MNKKVKMNLVAIGCSIYVATTLGGTIYQLSNDNQNLRNNIVALQNNKLISERTQQETINNLQNYSDSQEQVIKDLDIIAKKYAKEQEENKKLISIVTTNNTTIKEGQAKDIAKAITLFSVKYNVPTEELLAIIKVESNFNPEELGKQHDQGLMQIVPPTEKEIVKKLGVENYDIFNIYTNVEMGAYYISNLKSKYGRYAYIVYNQGLTKPLNDNTYEVNTNSSTSYISRVNEYTQKFKEEL